MYIFMQNIKFVKYNLKEGNETIFCNILEDKEEMEGKIAEVQQKIILEGRTNQHNQEEAHLLSQWRKRARKEEIIWRQKSRVQWL